MQIIALIDCNNFFVSCERVFNPSISTKPVIVLSNNDGIIIARSDEAKQLGLKMEPYFKIKDFCKNNDVIVLSSNHNLYNDMSSRVMSLLHEFSPEVEIYSIDEAFINLSHVPSFRLLEFAETIRTKILKDTGIPVSIGISTTKTIAKIAQNLAKKNSYNGIYSLLNKDDQTNVLSMTANSDIWGIGIKSARILEDLGIFNALEFRDMDGGIVRKYLKLSGQKIQQELKGHSCFEIEQIHEISKTITVSRSFYKPINKLEEMEYMVSEFAARASIKLRRQNSICSSIYVYIKTGSFNNKDKYIASTIEYFETSTANSSIIISKAKVALRRIFKCGYDFKKVGIILQNISQKQYKQLGFYEEAANAKDVSPIIDAINAKIGNRSLFYLAQGLQTKKIGRSNFCSKRYTTKWEELLNVQ